MPYFDRKDICSAYSVFRYAYGGSLRANIFSARLSEIGCKHVSLRTKEMVPWELSPNAKRIFGALVRRWHQQNPGTIDTRRFARRARGRLTLEELTDLRECLAAWGVTLEGNFIGELSTDSMFPPPPRGEES